MQLLTFLLNGVKFGIPVNDVESIETRMNVVNIPNSLPQVHGIMNLHGEVIAVYSLAEQFHYPEQEINNIIVASMNGTKIGLEVGNVDEIIDVPDEKVISMPVIMKAVENCFDEVASYAKELIVLIEVSKLMPEAEQQANTEIGRTTVIKQKRVKPLLLYIGKIQSRGDGVPIGTPFCVNRKFCSISKIILNSVRFSLHFDERGVN